MAADDLWINGIRHHLEASVKPVESIPDGQARRLKDLSLFFVSVLILVTIVAFSIFLLSSQCVPDDDRKWALSTLTAVFGGVLGWLIKR